MAKLDERIGFLGGGNMAFAIGNGLMNRGTVPINQYGSSLIVFIVMSVWYPMHRCD